MPTDAGIRLVSMNIPSLVEKVGHPMNVATNWYMPKIMTPIKAAGYRQSSKKSKFPLDGLGGNSTQIDGVA